MCDRSTNKKAFYLYLLLQSFFGYMVQDFALIDTADVRDSGSLTPVLLQAHRSLFFTIHSLIHRKINDLQAFLVRTKFPKKQQSVLF